MEGSVAVQKYGVDHAGGAPEPVKASQEAYKPLVFAVGVIAGVGTLFLSKNTFLQKLGCILTIGSLAKMHFDLAKIKEKASLDNVFRGRSLVEIIRDKHSGPKRKLELIWEDATILFRQSLQDPKLLRENVVYSASYVVGTLALFSSNAALKTLFLVSSLLQIKNAYDQCIDAKANAEKEISIRKQDVEAEALDNWFLQNKQDNPFDEGTPMCKACDAILTVEASLESQITNYEIAHEECPRSMQVLRKLVEIFIAKYADMHSKRDNMDLDAAQDYIEKMKAIDPNNDMIGDLEDQIADLRGEDQRRYDGEDDQSIDHAGTSSGAPSIDSQERKMTPYELGNLYFDQGDFKNAYSYFKKEYTDGKRDCPFLMKLLYCLTIHFDGYTLIQTKQIKESMQVITENGQYEKDPMFVLIKTAQMLKTQCTKEEMKKNLQVVYDSIMKLASNPSLPTDSSYYVEFYLKDLAEICMDCFVQFSEENDPHIYYTWALDLLLKYKEKYPNHVDAVVAADLGHLYLYGKPQDLQEAEYHFKRAQEYGYNKDGYSIASKLEEIARLQKQ